MKNIINNYNKIIRILNRTQKFYVIILILLFIFVAALETLSLGLILPLIYILINQDSSIFYLIKDTLSMFYVNIKNNDVIILSILFVSLLYVVKAIILAFVIKLNLNITAKISVDLTNDLYKSYLNEDFIFHLNENSSKLTRNILGEVHNCANILSISTQLIGEILMVILISIMLVFIEPMAVITIIAFLSVIAGSYYIIFSNFIERLGKVRQNMDFLRIKFINEGFSLIKEVKVYKLEDIFLSRHNSAYKKSINSEVNINFLTNIAKPILETATVLIFMGFLLFLIISKNNTIILFDYIPLIALLGAATFRVLPAINGINQKFQLIKYLSPSIDAVFQNLVDLKNVNFIKSDKRKILFKNNIKISNLDFYYSNKKHVIKNLNFEINKYDIFGIIGRSGSGKTTLMSLLMGILKPNSGKIICDGDDINSSINSWYDNISYVSQNVVLFDDTIKNNIIFGKSFDKTKFNDVIKKSQLTNLIKKLPMKEESEVGERGVRISGGEKQRIAIARALYRNSKIIFLDEATNSLDQKTENEFIDTILQLNDEITFVIIAHNSKMIDICNKKISLEDTSE